MMLANQKPNSPNGFNTAKDLPLNEKLERSLKKMSAEERAQEEARVAHEHARISGSAEAARLNDMNQRNEQVEEGLEPTMETIIGTASDIGSNVSNIASAALSRLGNLFKR